MVSSCRLYNAFDMGGVFFPCKRNCVNDLISKYYWTLFIVYVVPFFGCEVHNKMGDCYLVSM